MTAIFLGSAIFTVVAVFITALFGGLFSAYSRSFGDYTTALKPTAKVARGVGYASIAGFTATMSTSYLSECVKIDVANSRSFVKV